MEHLDCTNLSLTLMKEDNQLQKHENFHFKLKLNETCLSKVMNSRYYSLLFNFLIDHFNIFISQTKIN